MENNEAEIIRLKYKYRRLVLDGKIKLRYKLIGPDSAYHLYFTLNNRCVDKKIKSR